MAKRRYTRWGEKAVAHSCTNRKCNWEGLDSEKEWSKPINKDGMRILLCPNCGNDEFYGLLELPERLKKEL